MTRVSLPGNADQERAWCVVRGAWCVVRDSSGGGRGGLTNLFDLCVALYLWLRSTNAATAPHPRHAARATRHAPRRVPARRRLLQPGRGRCKGQIRGDGIGIDVQDMRQGEEWGVDGKIGQGRSLGDHLIDSGQRTDQGQQCFGTLHNDPAAAFLDQRCKADELQRVA